MAQQFKANLTETIVRSVPHAITVPDHVRMSKRVTGHIYVQAKDTDEPNVWLSLEVAKASGLIEATPV